MNYDRHHFVERPGYFESPTCRGMHNVKWKRSCLQTCICSFPGGGEQEAATKLHSSRDGGGTFTLERAAGNGGTISSYPDASRQEATAARDGRNRRKRIGERLLKCLLHHHKYTQPQVHVSISTQQKIRWNTVLKHNCFTKMYSSSGFFT